MSYGRIVEARNLVYVPNKFCNLGCRYCYLGTETNKVEETSDCVDKLIEITDAMHKEGVIVNQFFLHGAEITAMNKDHLLDLFKYMKNYKKTWQTELKVFSEPREFIHIKTNLFNFDKLQPMFEDYGVSISGSFDLPFSSHEKYRVTKGGKSTLDKILGNIKLLKDYKHKKTLSCVVTKEAFNNVDEFIKDLRYMHEEIGYDMINDFYIMFSYDSKAADLKFEGQLDNATMLSQEELVIFYNRLKEEFWGTPYEKAMRYVWFKEFLPGYCTFKQNCGESLLVQKDGTSFPCHRAQPNKKYNFGNIIRDGYKNVSLNGLSVIRDIENEQEIATDCLTCEYFKYCYLNCTLIRDETKMDRSYTCSLQKELYKDNPERFPPAPQDDSENDRERSNFLLNNSTKNFVYSEFERPYFENREQQFKKNYLSNIIKEDETLAKLYNLDEIKVEVNGSVFEMPNIFLYGIRPIMLDIKPGDVVKIHIKKDYFNVNCPDRDVVNNTLKVIALRDTIVQYGAEGRSKQQHTFDSDVFADFIREESVIGSEYLALDISSTIHANADKFVDDVHNNIYVTTRYAREYHYKMQAANAFYHIQAINLPFHHFSFYYRK